MSMVPAQSSDLAEMGEIPEGLEDFDPQDLGMPVIRIDGKLKPRPWLAEGQTGPAFVDNLSGMEWATMTNIVVLGMLKQRVLWPANMGDSDVPMCRSFDGKTGVPTDGLFPWGAATVFDRDALKTGEREGKEPGSILNVYAAPCDHCPLKEWGTHPSKEAPWCTLQHTYPVLVPMGEQWVPALLSLQRSSIKPSNNYIGAFSRAKQAMYTIYTTITLDPRTKGSTDYAVPVFKRGTATPTEDYSFFSDKYRGVKEYVRTSRGFSEAAGDIDAPTAGDPTRSPVAVPHPAEAAATTEPPTPTAPTPAPQEPAPTAPSPAATAPVTPAVVATAAPSEPAPAVAAPPQPPAPPQPVWDGANGIWIQPAWNGTAWEFPAPAAPAAPATEVDDAFDAFATPTPVPSPAPPAPAAAGAPDDDDIPF